MLIDMTLHIKIYVLLNVPLHFFFFYKCNNNNNEWSLSCVFKVAREDCMYLLDMNIIYHINKYEL